MSARAKYFVCFVAMLACFIALDQKVHLSGWANAYALGAVMFAFACGGYSQQQRIDKLTDLLKQMSNTLERLLRLKSND